MLTVRDSCICARALERVTFRAMYLNLPERSTMLAAYLPGNSTVDLAEVDARARPG